jgi:hypothetical protein
MTQSPQHENTIPASSSTPQKIGVYERPDTPNYMNGFIPILIGLFIAIIFIILLSFLLTLF